MLLQPKYVTMLIALLSLSCQGRGQQSLSYCGEIKSFSVNPEEARRNGLPEISFELSYPSNMIFEPATAGEKNYNYATFYSLDEAGNRSDMVSVGYYTMEGDDGQTIDVLNEQLISQIRNIYRSSFDLSYEFSGKRSFYGKEYPMYQAIGSIDRAEAQFVGTYYIQVMLIRPTPSAGAGLVFIFQSNENAGILALSDIGAKGCSSIIWSSLKFKE